MKPIFAILVVLFVNALLTGCERGPSEAQRLAEERATLEREKAQLADDKAASDRDTLAAERDRLAEERAALGEDNAKLSARARTERDARIAAERRAKEESTARKATEERAKETAQSAAVQARAEQSVEFFHDALDPHGDWIKLERYGYCWQPEQARNPRWRPYTDGSWVFTDYGWTWRGNEPFGWATYHYGRWTRLPRLGWVWVPGTEWGPAWVSWRRSDEYIGWAPLPPDAWSPSGFTAAVDSYYDIGPGLYAFVPVADFGEQTYVGKVVAPEQNVTIVNQTTNVTNVTYKTVQNNVTVVNNGPDIGVINERSRVPVQRLAVERVTESAANAQPAAVKGKTLRMMAPFFKDRAPAAAPKRVKEEVKEATEDRGWAEAKDEAPKLRDQAAKRARQAEEEQRVDGATEESTRRRVRVVPPDGTPSAPSPAAAADRLESLLPRPVTPPRATAPLAQPGPATGNGVEKPNAAEPRELRKKKNNPSPPDAPAAPDSSDKPAAQPASDSAPTVRAPVSTQSPASTKSHTAQPASGAPGATPAAETTELPRSPAASDAAPTPPAPAASKAPAVPIAADAASGTPVPASIITPVTPSPSDPAPATAAPAKTKSPANPSALEDAPGTPAASSKAPATPPASLAEKGAPPATPRDAATPEADGAAAALADESADGDRTTKAAVREQRRKQKGLPPESAPPQPGSPAPR